ncbi:acyltransferase [Pedobacter arcticus]|uniref:acyltransferase n=1 Tax=Pedobacter arcticus TaxID=752140 RepID=UPI000304C1B8|nr:acyltransferase [Pedobacter arcticus]
MKSTFKRIIKKIFFEDKENDLKRYKANLDVNPNAIIKSFDLDFRSKIENRKYVTIGSNCLISATFTFETSKGEIKIGNNIHIGGAHFICRTKIEIEDDVTMAWGITIYDHNSHSIYWEERKNDNLQCYKDYLEFNGDSIKRKDWSNVVSRPILIKCKAWVGFNVTILKGVTIGEGAVIGAGSFVVKDVEPFTVVGGNPARLIKRIE